MLYIQSAGYVWCVIASAFLFILLMKSIIDDIGKEPFHRLLLVTIALCLPLLFMALYFSAMAVMLLFW